MGSTKEFLSGLYLQAWLDTFHFSDLDSFCRTTVQWNLYNAVTLGPTFYGCNLEGGCIIEVHSALAICTLRPNKVALIREVAALYSDHVTEVPLYYYAMNMTKVYRPNYFKLAQFVANKW